MRALQCTEFGPVSNLRLIELPEPQPIPQQRSSRSRPRDQPSDVKNVEGRWSTRPCPACPARLCRHGHLRPVEWIAWRSGEPAARSAIRSMVAMRN